MLRKLIAGWLAVLTFVPFTAPFPTCELAALLAGRAASPVHRSSQATAVDDASLSPALPLSRPSGRVRLMALSESRGSADCPAQTPAALVRAARAVRAGTPRASLTILRI